MKIIFIKHFMQNSDQNEIDKFSKLAKDWWNLDGSSKPLHQINPVRLEYIKNQLQACFGEDLSNLEGLDVGSGGGILTESLVKLDINMTGLDLSADALAVAKDHAQSENLKIEYIEESIESFAQKHIARFDFITCMEMLEHVPDPASVIQACSLLLKPDGLLFLATINRNIKSKLFMIYGAEHIARMVPKGTHDFDRFIKPSELIQITERANLIAVDLVGIEYKLFDRQFVLSDNIDINYILMVRKPYS